MKDVEPDGSYSILYDDGDAERNVGKEMMRSYSNSSNEGKYAIGSIIEAKSQITGKFSPAKVIGINTENTHYEKTSSIVFFFCLSTFHITFTRVLVKN